MVHESLCPATKSQQDMEFISKYLAISHLGLNPGSMGASPVSWSYDFFAV